MLHPDRAIHLGLRYGFLSPAEVEGAEKKQKKSHDYDELKSILINGGIISEDRMIMLDSVVTEERAYDKGDILGEKYKIIRPIGAGAMAKVILAKNIESGLLVALKLVPVGEKENKNLKYRFQQEVRLHSTLKHSNIAQLYDNFQHDGRQVLAVEYFEGESLARRLERGPLSLRRSLEVSFQIGRALTYLHHRGLVHRDIKPGNILLTKDGEVKLLDLGLAKNLKDPNQYTQSGAIVGTPQYMAPEQAQGEGLVDERADIYGLGVTLFHMVTGRPPFRGTRREIIASHLKKEVPDSRKFRRGVPHAIRDLIKKMTHRNPEHRYKEAEILCNDLANILDQNIKLREELLLLPYNRKFIALSMVVLGVVLGALLFYYFNGLELLKQL